MKVYFIGAGPGAADLISLRGAELIKRCAYCLYAGSLVPPALVASAPEGTKVVDTAPLNLEEILALIEEAAKKKKDVARLHSGDPSLYGAIAEQIRALEARGIAYEIVPGIPAFAALAAELKQELTLPGINQSLVITRVQGKASPMPEGQTLANFAQSGATLALHLSVRSLKQIVEELLPFYGTDCPVVVGYRVSWPDQQIIRGRLCDIRRKLRQAKITRTALILVGPALAAGDFFNSRLYAKDYQHLLRFEKKRKGKD